MQEAELGFCSPSSQAALVWSHAGGEVQGVEGRWRRKGLRGWSSGGVKVAWGWGSATTAEDILGVRDFW